MKVGHSGMAATPPHNNDEKSHKLFYRLVHNDSLPKLHERTDSDWLNKVFHGRHYKVARTRSVSGPRCSSGGLATNW